MLNGRTRARPRVFQAGEAIVSAADLQSDRVRVVFDLARPWTPDEVTALVGCVRRRWGAQLGMPWLTPRTALQWVETMDALAAASPRDAETFRSLSRQRPDAWSAQLRGIGMPIGLPSMLFERDPAKRVANFRAMQAVLAMDGLVHCDLTLSAPGLTTG